MEQPQLIQLQEADLEDKVYEAFLESMDETITALLSREVVNALYIHLQRAHSMPRTEVPYKTEDLCSTLNKIFGTAGTATISKAIARRLFIKLGLTFSDNPPRTLAQYLQEAKSRIEAEREMNQGRQVLARRCGEGNANSTSSNDT
jgi:hypothetical protein